MLASASSSQRRAVTSKARFMMLLCCALAFCWRLATCACSLPAVLPSWQPLAGALSVVLAGAGDAPGTAAVVGVLSDTGQQSALLCGWLCEDAKGRDQLVTKDQRGSGRLSASNKAHTTDAMDCMRN
jgi:hypothetical protein